MEHFHFHLDEKPVTGRPVIGPDTATPPTRTSNPPSPAATAEGVTQDANVRSACLSEGGLVVICKIRPTQKDIYSWGGLDANDEDA